MGRTDSSRAGHGRSVAGPAAPPSGLLDLLNVAEVVLNAQGQVVFWSPKAEELFGCTAGKRWVSTRCGRWSTRSTGTR